VAHDGAPWATIGGMTDQRPIAVVERIKDAVNRHDLEALMMCYAPGVHGEEPTLVDRDFDGSDQLRMSWEQILSAIPDLEMELLDVVEAGDRVWAEWCWHGSRADGSRIERHGVIIYDVRADLVVRLRRYMGPLVSPPSFPT
jgi:ketosteroid isomerase-like protein